MNNDMNTRTVTIVVTAPRRHVFDFLSRIENLPVWATEFCEGLRKVDGHWKVVTSAGELFFRIDAHAETGVIDMFAGPTPGEMAIFPVRVLALPTGQTAVSFTFFQLPGMPDELYERQYKSLLIEMEGLRKRFTAA